MENRRRQEKKLQRKLKTKITDIHLKACNFLTTQYDLVSLGKLNVSAIIKNKRENLGLPKLSKRYILAWRHYDFRQRLLHRFRGEPDKRLIIQDEHYTSKTCSACGKSKSDLGAAEWFLCDFCGRRMNRDVNAAKNILKTTLNTIFG